MNIKADLDKKYHEYEENELEKLENRVKNLGVQSNNNKAEASSSIMVDSEDQKTNELVKKLLKEIEDEQEQEEKVNVLNALLLKFSKFVKIILLFNRTHGVVCVMQMLILSV